MIFRQTSRRFVLVALVALCVFLPACLPAPQPQPQAKYIFYVIGDGMGPSQVEAAERFIQARPEMSGRDDYVYPKLAMNLLPHSGTCTTHSNNSAVTDSAAAGTALACGVKTDGGVMAMRPDRKTPVPSIAHVLKKNGYRIGIISTAEIDHATPGVFYAHEPSRGNYYEIATTIGKTGFEYFAGVGCESALPHRLKGRPSPFEVIRADGYTVCRTMDELRKVQTGNRRVACALNVPWEIDRKANDPRLVHMVREGIRLLGTDKNFFMMIEGGRIDWSCHENDGASTVLETIAMDEVIQELITFYMKHPTETLIVVTADHETGGMQLAGDKHAEARRILPRQKILAEHTAPILKKLRAKKLPADKAIVELDKIFGFGKLTPEEHKLLADTWTATLSGDPKTKSKFKSMYGRYDPVEILCTRFMNRKAGIAWRTFGHSATPVPVRAVGVGAKAFAGRTDNTDLPRLILKAANISEANLAKRK